MVRVIPISILTVLMTCIHAIDSTNVIRGCNCEISGVSVTNALRNCRLEAVKVVDKSVEKEVFERKILTLDGDSDFVVAEAKLTQKTSDKNDDFNTEHSIYNEMLFAEMVSNAIDAIDIVAGF